MPKHSTQPKFSTQHWDQDNGILTDTCRREFVGNFYDYDVYVYENRYKYRTIVLRFGNDKEQFQSYTEDLILAALLYNPAPTVRISEFAMRVVSDALKVYGPLKMTWRIVTIEQLNDMTWDELADTLIAAAITTVPHNVNRLKKWLGQGGADRAGLIEEIQYLQKNFCTET